MTAVEEAKAKAAATQVLADKPKANKLKLIEQDRAGQKALSDKEKVDKQDRLAQERAAKKALAAQAKAEAAAEKARKRVEAAADKAKDVQAAKEAQVAKAYFRAVQARRSSLTLRSPKVSREGTSSDLDDSVIILSP